MPAAPGPEMKELTDVYVAIVVMARTRPFMPREPMKYFFSLLIVLAFSWRFAIHMPTTTLKTR